MFLSAADDNIILLLLKNHAIGEGREMTMVVLH